MAYKTSSETVLDHLRDIHQKLQKKFTASQQEIKLAKRLEKFLNYVIYDKMPEKGSPFDRILTKQIADELKKDSHLRNLFQISTNAEAGQRGEQAFATAITQIVNSLVAPKQKVNVEDAIKEMIIGNQSATIIARNISDDHIVDLKKQLEAGKSIREYSSWNANFGKIDVDTSLLNIEGNLTPLARQLLNMTLSVKNYTDFQIHLEKVNRKKAYLAIISEIYPKASKQQLEKKYEKYQIKKIGTNLEVEEHLQHLINLYALTGYGQVYIDKAHQELIRKYAKFLAINNRETHTIIIRSTAEIAQQEIFADNGKSGFASRLTSKNKYAVSYKYT